MLGCVSLSSSGGKHGCWPLLGLKGQWHGLTWVKLTLSEGLLLHLISSHLCYDAVASQLHQKPDRFLRSAGILLCYNHLQISNKRI